MHLKQVETFLTVAECGSFSRAGEKLFISSSAVAQQIGSLEEDIGASLFHRTTHGVRLTEIGRYLAAEGRELVERSHIIQEHIQTMRFEQENCIVLGTSMWQNCSLFYSLWGKFVSEHEQYQLRTVRIRDASGTESPGRRIIPFWSSVRTGLFSRFPSPIRWPV